MVGDLTMSDDRRESIYSAMRALEKAQKVVRHFTEPISFRDRIATALFTADNGSIVAWMESDDPEIMDTDRVIDGTINFAKLADVAIAELEPLRQQLLAYARSGVEHGDMTPTSERALKRIMAHYWTADDD